VGQHILLAYLPAANAQSGAKLLVQYLGDRYPVTVAIVGSTPLFDPENERVRS
jgi:glycine cleavage system aminomethyltransferase T